MSENAAHPAARRLARIGLVLLTGAGLALASMASSPQATTLAQPVSTATDTPEPTAIPDCPGNTIDRNDNDQDNGDCIPLRDVELPAVPVSCVTPLGGLERYGRVTCQPLWRVNGIQMSIPVPPLHANQGCISVQRRPYPRMMVGLGTPTLSFNGLVPTDVGWMTGYSAGWYDVDLSGDELRGISAHGANYAAGNWLGQSLGSGVSDYPAVWLHNPSIDFYPDINELSMRLVYVLTERVAEPLEVAFTGGAGAPQFISWDGSQPLRLSATRSSNPSAPMAGDDLVGSGGPNRSGPADLPAYKLQVRSTWTLYVQWRYFEYAISPNAQGDGQYGRRSAVPRVEAVEVTGLQSVVGYRTWDTQQATRAGLSASPHCNALPNEGYIPVPVMEGQSVLVR